MTEMKRPGRGLDTAARGICRSANMEPNMDFSTREAFAVREFCARYGICRQTFYDEVKRGRIKAKKLGKKTVILRSDAEKWAASLPALNLAVTA